MKHNYFMLKFIISTILSISIAFQFQGCKPNSQSYSKFQNTKAGNEVQIKPPSNYQDTLIIKNSAAVFYRPDSIQLQSIKSITDSKIFDGIQHEYFYQFRNAHKVLKDNWPEITIIDITNIRYLIFKKTDGNSIKIDLNEFGDAYGLFLFNTKKSPELVDMTNIDNALYNNFSK